MYECTRETLFEFKKKIEAQKERSTVGAAPPPLTSIPSQFMPSFAAVVTALQGSAATEVIIVMVLC